jgi:hypothetical protein
VCDDRPHARALRPAARAARDQHRRRGVDAQRVGRPATRDPDQARSILAELLDLPRLLLEADGGLTVACLDEFQDLLTADVALDGDGRPALVDPLLGVWLARRGAPR